jgi:putative transposase
MTNHYHLIVETEHAALSLGMKTLNGRYAQLFNERHSRDGPLFKSRYSVFVIERDSHLEQSCLYVLENPVRAGLCNLPSEWPWSGLPHGAVAGTGTEGASPYSVHGGSSSARS